ncbi:LOW QUALITY PROTEIN: phenazine biosynthesis-like domain-containing protein [Pistacia vera]|uniref:LOW QUALITY PROTEIN: phenazine biosynthesis-like domain-containing protein n=1 Tax=Pistacia vera TaxID=55513 RepID=UPI001263617E|nr:LOW QUALITY PROTEIN: phenazine biosynthesis-like domain-containing protein [Pistacia vera]
MAKKLVQYSVVDAFTDSPFKGNPAAVCLLDEDRDEDWLQSVALEFNISETGYLTRLNLTYRALDLLPRFRLRWFPPVNFCGSATLAICTLSLFSRGLVNLNAIDLNHFLGILTAKKFRIWRCYFPHKICCGITATVWTSRIVLEKAYSFRARAIRTGFDFYADSFCPKFGINEDPVLEGGHCALAPYWSRKLGKNVFVAYAASPRSGFLNIHLDEQNQRVLLQGKL